MISADIITPRLRLVAITTEMLQADAAQDGTLRTLLAALVPSAWPPEHWEPHVFSFLEKQYADAPHTAAWNRYVVLQEQPPTLIGTIGGFPKGAHEAEVGYSILAPWQRRGLATEAMQTFVQELSQEGFLRSVTAQTFPNLVASRRVLEKCGFQPDGPGDEEGTIRYRFDIAT